MAEQNRGRPRWTDSGSMSSGVSSDLSSCETDLESCSRDADQPYSSDEDQDVVDRHYIQNEIMEKIRSFGTSVTYFGGQMIQCSVGPLVSPTTHAILEEIGQKQPNGSVATRSFDEFYKKYKESSKKRKVGRTRSFAQEEMFQKSSVFNNTEINEHKMELETAFGIRTPRGKTPTKTRLGKCYSLDSRLQSFENQIAAVGSFRKEERTDTVANPEPLTIANSATIKYRVGNEYFDCNRVIAPPKNDIEFEEFEVCENIYDKMARIKRESKEKQSAEIIQDSGNEGDEEKPRKLENNTQGDAEAREETEALGNKDSSLTQSDATNDENKNIGNSVQEKRNSYEEFIKQKGSDALKGNSSNCSSKRNSLEKSTEDITEICNGGELNVSGYNDTLKSLEENSETKEDTIENFQRGSPRSSTTASKVSAWENFERNRRYSSSENLSQMKRASVGSQENLKRASIGSQNGMKRASVGSQEDLKRASIGGQNGLKRASVGSQEDLKRASIGSQEGLKRASIGSHNGLKRASIGSQESMKRTSVDSQEALKRASTGSQEGLKRTSIGSQEAFKRASIGSQVGMKRTSKSSQEDVKRASIGSQEGAKRASTGSQDGSRRNSIKKLIDSEVFNQDFCRGSNRASLDSQRSNQSSRKSFEKEDGRKNSGISGRGSANSQNSKQTTKELINTEKRENNGWESDEVNIVNKGKRNDNTKLIENEKQNAKKETTESKERGHKITIKISQSEDDPCYKVENEEFEEIIINEQDPPDSLELYLPQKQDEEEDKEVKGIQNLVTDIDGALEYNRKQKGDKSNQSRWPVETTVVVDMEKNEGHAPKLISNGKAHVKTTKRLY